MIGSVSAQLEWLGQVMAEQKPGGHGALVMEEEMEARKEGATVTCSTGAGSASVPLLGPREGEAVLTAIPGQGSDSEGRTVSTIPAC